MHPGQLARATSLFRLLDPGSERRSRTVSPYLTFPQLEPSHLDVNALSIFMVWPLPAMEPCDDPLRCSWSRASTLNVAVPFISSDSQERVPFAAVLVEVMTVGVHSLFEAKSNFC